MIKVKLKKYIVFIGVIFFSFSLFCQTRSAKSIRWKPQENPPSNPVNGEMYYDTDGLYYKYDGSNWQTILNNSSFSEYETVNTIPNFITPDGNVVIGNGEGTYNILKIRSGSVPLSLFGVSADLRYEDVNITNGSNVIIGNFSNSDVGKRISVRYSYQNPDISNGNEIPNTPLGKLVTVDEVIISVVDGVSATITTNLNLTKATKAYIYTDNYNSIQNAIAFCNWKEKILVPNLSGIAGVRVTDKSIPAIRLYSSEGITHIAENDSFKIKLCEETNNNAKALFFVDNGDKDVIINTSCIPPDYATTSLSSSFGSIFLTTGTTGMTQTTAGNSSRKIVLNNIGNFDRNLLNGSDGHWSFIIQNSLGGVTNANTDLIKYQKFYLKGSKVRLKSGGISLFSQNGATNQLFIDNIELDFSNHYDSQVGRESYASLQDNNGNWTFTYNITKSGTTLSVESGVDFNWNDYIGSFGTDVNINGTDLRISSVINSKTVEVTGNLTDNTYSGFIIDYDAETFNHPVYVHPNVSYKLNNVTCTFGSVRFYSSSGQSGIPLFTDIIDSNLNTPQGLETFNSGVYNGVEHNIINSTVNFDQIGQYQKIIARNSHLKGGKIECNELESLGSNRFSVSANVNNTINFRSYNDQFDNLSQNLRFLNSDAVLTLNNPKFSTVSYLPYTQGKIYIENASNTFNNRLVLNSNSFASTTEVYFNNIKNEVSGEVSFDIPAIGVSNSEVGKINIDENCIIPFTSLTEPTQSIIDSNRYNFSVSKATSDTQDLLFIKSSLYRNTPYMVLRSDLYMAGVDLYRADKWKLDNFYCNYMFANTTNYNRATYWSDYRHGRTAYYSGEFTLEIGQNVILTPLENPNTGATSKRDNATLGNFVVKTLDRVEGEIITFRIDRKYGRFVEVHSSVPKKYTTSMPTRKGVQDEILFIPESNNFYKYNITYTNLDNTVLTESITTKSEDFEDGTGTISSKTVQVINLSLDNLTIFQEKTDGSDLAPFSFKLILDDLSEVTFEHTNEYENLENNNIAPQLMLNMWTFKSTDSLYTCYINNVSGEIVFSDNYNFTLNTTNNFEIITGNRIASQSWSLISTSGGTDTIDDVADRGNSTDKKLLTTGLGLFDVFTGEYYLWDSEINETSLKRNQLEKTFSFLTPNTGNSTFRAFMMDGSSNYTDFDFEQGSTIANITIPNESGKMLLDAPNDGTKYVRQNESWIAESSSEGSTVRNFTWTQQGFRVYGSDTPAFYGASDFPNGFIVNTSTGSDDETALSVVRRRICFRAPFDMVVKNVYYYQPSEPNVEIALWKSDTNVSNDTFLYHNIATNGLLIDDDLTGQVLINKGELVAFYVMRPDTTPNYVEAQIFIDFEEVKSN